MSDAADARQLCEQLSVRGGAAQHRFAGCFLRTKSGSLADGINRYHVISFMLSCSVLLTSSSSSHRYSWNSIISPFFPVSPPCSGPSVVILSRNRNHATGINWAVIAEALSTWTMLNCVHCAGTMTRNFISPLVPSALHSNTSISLFFTPTCGVGALTLTVWGFVCVCFCFLFFICGFGRSQHQIRQSRVQTFFSSSLNKYHSNSSSLLQYFCIRAATGLDLFTSTHSALLYVTL